MFDQGSPTGSLHSDAATDIGLIIPSVLAEEPQLKNWYCGFGAATK